MEGPGRFYFTGFNVVFLDMNLLKDALHQMVTMSPLQSYTLEVIPSSDEVAVIGAGVVGLQAMESSK
jgi:heterodisulfide reductase subunit A-like polyferredoxin